MPRPKRKSSRSESIERSRRKSWKDVRGETNEISSPSNCSLKISTKNSKTRWSRSSRRRASTVYARMVIGEAQGELQVQQFAEIYSSDVLPELTREPGFEAAHFMVEEDGRMAVSLTVWKTR